VAHGLRAGERIACFPEGTSAAQGAMLPFRANLFESAIGTGIPVQPLALVYLDGEGALHPAVEYIEDVSLAESMIGILSGKPICARLVTLPALAPGAGDRRALAASAQAQVRHVLSQHLPIDSMMQAVAPTSSA
jgi:1-acyl-sn-glycerol-3-phosphate acyltransferase